jgi:yecA family protein
MTPQRRRRALSLEELDDWLASDQAPAKGGWNVSAVDGFLAGIVIGAEPIEPKEWTRLIFGARPLSKGGDAAVQAVLDRHATVAKILAEAPTRYVPLFKRTDEGVVLAQDWAAGFLAAVRLRLEAWRPLLEGPAGSGCCCRSWSTRLTRRLKPRLPGSRLRGGTIWPRLTGTSRPLLWPFASTSCLSGSPLPRPYPGPTELAWVAYGDP